MKKEGMRIAMLISGGGTTMLEILRACDNGRLSGVVPALVIASTKQAGGIAKALDHGLPREDVLVMPRASFLTPESFGAALLGACRERGIDFVGQYGWLPLTPANLIESYVGRMTNQHPGPLDVGRPDFGGKGMYGRRVHAARLNFVSATGFRDPWTEVVAQRVHPQFDRGAVVHLARVPIGRDDDVAALQARTLPVEHRVQIETLQMFADNNVRELWRNDPLIPPHEVPILEKAKADAIEAWPKG